MEADLSDSDTGIELKQWLIMDTWPYEKAMLLIAGLIPCEIYDLFGYFKIDGKLLHNDHGEKEEKDFIFSKLKRLWLSNPENPKVAPPSFYLKWAKSKNIEIDWLESVQKHGYLIEEDSKSSIQEDKPLSTRERDNLLKLVIGMAIKGYGYDPKSKKSASPKEIADDLAAQVRHFLNVSV